MTPVPDLFDLFLPAVGRWFSRTFDQPTRPQTEGWPHIAGGANTLVIAPTGSRFGVVSRELCDGDWGTRRLVLTRLEYAGEIERDSFPGPR